MNVYVFVSDLESKSMLSQYFVSFFLFFSVFHVMLLLYHFIEASLVHPSGDVLLLLHFAWYARETPLPVILLYRNVISCHPFQKTPHLYKIHGK